MYAYSSSPQYRLVQPSLNRPNTSSERTFKAIISRILRSAPSATPMNMPYMLMTWTKESLIKVLFTLKFLVVPWPLHANDIVKFSGWVLNLLPAQPATLHKQARVECNSTLDFRLWPLAMSKANLKTMSSVQQLRGGNNLYLVRCAWAHDLVNRHGYPYEGWEKRGRPRID